VRKLVPIKVESQSGYKADEYPRRFLYDGISYDVTEITARWYQGDIDPDVPVSDYFRVETTSGRQFLIKHEIRNDLWYLLL
jgi:hypothetical protein